MFQALWENMNPKLRSNSQKFWLLPKDWRSNWSASLWESKYNNWYLSLLTQYHTLTITDTLGFSSSLYYRLLLFKGKHSSLNNQLYILLSVQYLRSPGEDQTEFLFPEKWMLANPVACWRSLISNRKMQDHMNAQLRTPEAKTQWRGDSPSTVGQKYFRD